MDITFASTATVYFYVPSSSQDVGVYCCAPDTLWLARPVRTKTSDFARMVYSPHSPKKTSYGQFRLQIWVGYFTTSPLFANNNFSWTTWTSDWIGWYTPLAILTQDMRCLVMFNFVYNAFLLKRPQISVFSAFGVSNNCLNEHTSTRSHFANDNSFIS